MKRKFMKKALAVVLSTAMAFSLSSAAEMKTASAAKKFVGLNTTFKTLKVGQKDYKLKLVNNTAKWKINKVSTTDKTIATVYGKTASYVLLKGKGEGRATIKLSLKTTARKKNNTKTLRCRVNVVPAADPGTTTPDPGTTTPDPVETNAVVKNQAELDAALAKATVTNIKIDTTDAAKFVIPAGDHKGVDLTVNAPNSDVENSGVFKSITISAIKDSTWLERALGNRVNFNAPKGRFVVAEGASVAGITLTAANSEVKLEVNGTLAGVTINVSVKLTITGTTKVKVPVTVAQGAKGATVDTAVPTDVKAAADVNVTLQSGAAGSTVEVTDKGANVTTENKTGSTVAVTDANGKTTNVSTGSTNKVTGTTSTTPGGNTGTSGGTTTTNRPSSSSASTSSSSTASSSSSSTGSSSSDSSTASSGSGATTPGTSSSGATTPGTSSSGAATDPSNAVTVDVTTATVSGTISGDSFTTSPASITIDKDNVTAKVGSENATVAGIGIASSAAESGTTAVYRYGAEELGTKTLYIKIGEKKYSVQLTFKGSGTNAVTITVGTPTEVTTT